MPRKPTTDPQNRGEQTDNQRRATARKRVNRNARAQGVGVLDAVLADRWQRVDATANRIYLDPVAIMPYRSWH